MAMSSIESANQQLNLLDAAGASSAPLPLRRPRPKQPRRQTTPTTGARRPSMVATASLVECPTNPRTEFPDAELDELAEDIRQHGILQPIVVHPADVTGRHEIHFGAKRWRAAQRIGLKEVPVVVHDAPTNPYAQVAENQKRHGLTPLDLARFIRSRIDTGETNTAVASQLGMDLTTVAHHLALLDLPPVLEAALQAGRCVSPRTLYELSKLHGQQPAAVAALMAGTGPITREAVATIRSKADVASAVERVPGRRARCVTEDAYLLAYASSLCDKLEAALHRLGQADRGRLPPDDLAALRKRIEQAAARAISALR